MKRRVKIFKLFRFYQNKEHLTNGNLTYRDFMQDLLFFQLSLEVKTVSVVKDKYMQIIRVKIHIQKFFQNFLQRS